MTPTDTSAHRAPAGGLLRQTARRWPVLLWLWLLWIVLWGSVGPVVLLAGAVVAVSVTVLFPLPPITHRVAAHPVGVAVMAGHLLADLVVSALTVAREALLRGPRARAAVLEQRLDVDTDLLITATAHMTTLTPGTLVLEIDRGRRRFYVHALPVRDVAEAGKRRREVAGAERRVARALGTAGVRQRLLGRGPGGPEGSGEGEGRRR
ncbi:Na+/H+ antiporter subunit E [Streptomyces sp. TRM43335]|uniref:Na+/H+ antiporter subunit E n=1 Tax=Streptomyces taklimakanensis TaxID=2569853 RepID=A0A6G2BHM4_9ACTN|nr:Na+/H+ antiporter subunit E [Streptomyces taklimakanensis]MTE21787.1 Na+/H+ antiporter subunit E [Streptomyces taklimakanensis]